MEQQNRRAIMVGFFVFLGLILLVAGILVIGNARETFKQKIKVEAVFDDVSGLQVGNNVWFSGVKIGTVSDMEFFSKSKVRVYFKIDVKARPYISKDAMVKISSEGFIGSKILMVYGGSGAPHVEEGDTLIVEKTFSSDDVLNTLQENNKNFQEITNDIKTISKKLSKGEGTIGKLLNNDSIYTNIHAATANLQAASAKAQHMITSLQTFSSGLNKKGTLGNELATDTVVFNAMKKAVLNLQQVSDTASVLIRDLKNGARDPKSPIGTLLHDEESGKHLKETLKNLESSSVKLNEDLEALQHNIFFRRYFKKKEKEENKK